MTVLKWLFFIIAAIAIYSVGTTYQEYIKKHYYHDIFSLGAISAIAFAEFLLYYAIDFGSVSLDNKIVLIVISAGIVIAVLVYNIKVMGMGHGFLVTFVQMFAAAIALFIVLLILMAIGGSKEKDKKKN